jgi:S1-C subfamily serine protease
MPVKLSIQIVESPATPVFEFAGPTVIIGRNATCDLPVSSATYNNVSGQHARITLSASGAVLTDLNSTNGTFLNDRRVEGQKMLRRGDYFRLGQTGPTFQVVELDLRDDADFRTRKEPVRAAAPRGHEATHDLTPPMPRPVFPGQAGEFGQPVAAAPVPAAAPVAHSGGTTRLMLVQSEKRNRRNLVIMAVAGGGLFIVTVTVGILIVAGVWGHQQYQAGQLKDQLSEAELNAKKAQEDARKAQEQVGKVKPPPSKKLLQELFAKLVPSVPHIKAVNDQGWGEGTGFLVNHKGQLLVVTNRHVVEPGKKSLEVYFLRNAKNDDVERLLLPPAKTKLIAIHRKVDLAIIDVTAAADELAPWKVAPVNLAPLKHSPAVGEHVFAIGHPGDGAGGTLVRTLSDGIISSVGRTAKEFGGTFIQVTVPVNWGNSGGPIFDDEGKVIAIATFIRRHRKDGAALEGLNFGLEIRYVHELLADPSQSFTAEEIAGIIQGTKKTVVDAKDLDQDLNKRFNVFAQQGYRPLGGDLAKSRIPFQLTGNDPGKAWNIKLPAGNLLVFVVSRGSAEVGLAVVDSAKKKVAEDYRPRPDPEVAFNLSATGDFVVGVDNITPNPAEGYIVFLVK